MKVERAGDSSFVPGKRTSCAKGFVSTFDLVLPSR